MSDRISVNLLRNMVEAFGTLPEADQIQQLESLACSLLKKRARILQSMGELEGAGFFPKYFVFNNLTRMIDDDTFVLDPKHSEVDLEAIEFYAMNTPNRALGNALNSWAYSHCNHLCKFPTHECCPVVGYNLCCGHCANSEECFIQGNPYLCDRVANDMFTSIEECDG